MKYNFAKWLEARTWNKTNAIANDDTQSDMGDSPDDTPAPHEQGDWEPSEIDPEDDLPATNDTNFRIQAVGKDELNVAFNQTADLIKNYLIGGNYATKLFTTIKQMMINAITAYSQVSEGFISNLFNKYKAPAQSKKLTQGDLFNTGARTVTDSELYSVIEELVEMLMVHSNNNIKWVRQELGLMLNRIHKKFGMDLETQKRQRKNIQVKDKPQSPGMF